MDREIGLTFVMVPSPLAGQIRRRHRVVPTGIFPGNIKWLSSDKELFVMELAARTTAAD